MTLLSSLASSSVLIASVLSLTCLTVPLNHSLASVKLLSLTSNLSVQPATGSGFSGSVGILGSLSTLGSGSSGLIGSGSFFILTVSGCGSAAFSPTSGCYISLTPNISSCLFKNPSTVRRSASGISFICSLIKPANST